jgi:hypothetical protein
MADLGAGGVSTFPGATPGAPYPQYFGIYFGVVNNNADPLTQNRCLLQVPQLFGTGVTTWATCLTPLQSPPAVGTVITAMFIGGDVDHPCYLVTDPAMLALESNSANIQPVGTANAAGNSKNAAAANHVHKLVLSAVAPLLDTNASDIQPLGTQAAGASGIPCDAAHTHSNVTFNLTVTNELVAGVIDCTTQFITPAGYAVNSVATPTITTVPHNTNDPAYGGSGGTTWVSGERLVLDNQIDKINTNFANIVSALQSAGLWH